MKRPAVSRPAAPPRPAAFDYPDSDGQPIAETDFQRKALWYANDVLARRYRDHPDVYVSANLFVYYEEGDPRAVVAPDVFVVLGVAGHDRRAYKVWEEGKVPDFVLEVTSRSTRATDQGSKRQVYAKLGVSEYWRFDPTGDYLDPPLVGERLEGDRYVRLPLDSSREGSLAGRSTVLGLDLTVAQGRLRFRDSATGEALPASDELERRVVQETRAREAAEARAARTEARLRALQDISSDPPGRAIE